MNQIPYDYTVEVRNRFKGLDLTDRVPDELWMEAHDICTGGSDQDCHAQTLRIDWREVHMLSGLTQCQM